MNRIQRVAELTEFLKESNRSLDGILKELNWDLKTTKGNEDFVVCPQNSHHWVPRLSVDSHVKSCRNSSLKIDEKNVLPSSEFCYESIPSVVTVKLDKERYNSFKETSCSDKQNLSTHDHKRSTFTRPEDDIIIEESRDPFASLLDRSSTYTIAPSAHHEIRNIMNWRLIPAQYEAIETGMLDMTQVRTWIIKNLPSKGSFRAVIGGDVQVLNFISFCLSQGSSMTPDSLLAQLKALLETETRSFVLALWKYLCVQIMCKRNNIPKDEMDAIIPVLSQFKSKSSEPEQIQDPFISSVPVQQSSDSEEFSLPVDFAWYDLSQAERTQQYDYIVKVGKARNREKGIDISDLAFELDDGNKNNDEEKSKSHVEMMAEMRDYKRRRQSYRAKNVHITKRSATDVQRDLLEVMMGAMESIHRKHQRTDKILDEDAQIPQNVEKESEEKQDERLQEERKEPKGTRREEKERRDDRDRERESRHRDSDRDRDRHRERDKERDGHRRERKRSRSRDRDSEREKSRHKHRHKHKHDR